MREFRILPVIAKDGSPMWRLVMNWSLPIFGCGSKTMAENEDRAVLERAIAHLEQPGSAGGVQP